MGFSRASQGTFILCLIANKAKAAWAASQPLSSKENLPAQASEAFGGSSQALDIPHLASSSFPPSLLTPNSIQLASLGPVPRI